MKRFNLNAILYHPKTIMQFIGMWPKKEPSLSYDLLGITSFLFSSVFTIICGIRCFQDFVLGNYENGIYIFCLVLCSFHAAFKILFMQMQKPLFFQILEELENPSLASHRDDVEKYLENKINLSMKVFNLTLIFCLSASIAINISDFVFDYKSAPRLLPIHAYYNSDPITYLLSWAFIFIAVFFCGYIIGCFEGLVFTLISLGVAQLQILQDEIKYSIDLYSSQILDSKDIELYNQLTNQLLAKCVKRHNAIERYVTALERKFGFSYLVQLLITLGVTGSIGVNFIFVPVNSPDFMKCACLLIADIIQVFISCLSCNQIIIESEMIGEACYMSNWRLYGPSVHQTIRIIMERSKRPLCLTAGKFAKMSLETYLVVLKTSASYFTVLKKLCAEEL